MKLTTTNPVPKNQTWQDHITHPSEIAEEILQFDLESDLQDARWPCLRLVDTEVHPALGSDPVTITADVVFADFERVGNAIAELADTAIAETLDAQADIIIHTNSASRERLDLIRDTANLANCTHHTVRQSDQVPAGMIWVSCSADVPDEVEADLKLLANEHSMVGAR